MKFVPFASGSKGNAYFIQSNGTNILVDIGISLRKCVFYLAELDIQPEEVDGIVVSHAHADHMRSVPGFAKKYNTPVYASKKTLKRLNKWLDSSTMTYDLSVHDKIGNLSLTMFQTYHDVSGSTGISVSNLCSRISIITDTGKIDDRIRYFVDQSDILVLEANYDKKMLWQGPYPRYIKSRIDSDYGHLSNESALEILNQSDLSRLQALYIGHISENNNSIDLVKKLFQDSNNGLPHGSFQFEIAHQHKPSNAFEITESTNG